MRPPRGWLSRPTVVWLAALTTALKLWVAASTYGTDDVRYWTSFSGGALRYGPLHLYGHAFPEAPYNHPPLMGWVLWVAGRLAEHGWSFPFLIRAPACLADAATALLLFALVRAAAGERVAAGAALVFLTSPVAFVVSGFHGNTDPVFVMFVLLSAWCLVVARSGVGSGVALGVALSIKVVPVVVVPALLVLAWRSGGRRHLGGLVAGGLGVFVLLWVPVLLVSPSAVVEQVLLYAGSGPRQWGLTQFAEWAGVPPQDARLIGDRARLAITALAALVPAAVLWRSRLPVERQALHAALGLPLLLLLSPAFAMQYLVWALAPLCLTAGLLPAATYSAIAGVFTLVVYSGWNHAWPWEWYEARSTPLPSVVLPLAVVVWLALARGVAVGLRSGLRGDGSGLRKRVATTS